MKNNVYTSTLCEKLMKNQHVKKKKLKKIEINISNTVKIFWKLLNAQRMQIQTFDKNFKYLGYSFLYYANKK